ncbi:hypothetical protein [Bacillus cereus]|uniref:hypothetical protein n=1 Tax=Bacillus cereus TaxID=1396 RepID=UPI0025702A17|nr:hypothetical protein [Bacillus cereus]MDM5461103.1 hypothetical protein [Bacillus cereus]WJE27016.1 hypothetical protein QRE65_09075 [Bacillus cereus]
MKKIMGSIVISAILLAAGCSKDDVDEVVNKADKKVKEEVAVATTKDHEHVQQIKTAKLPGYEKVTIEEAFHKFFKNPKWKYFVSEDHEDLVEFTGDCVYQEQEVKAKIQFVLNKEDQTFKLKAMALNDIAQNRFTTATMLHSIYGGDDHEEEIQNNKDEVKEDGKPEGSVKADSYFEEDKGVDGKPEGSVKADSYFEEDKGVDEKPEGSVKADSYFEEDKGVDEKPEGSVKADSYFEEDKGVDEKPEGSVKADSYFEEDNGVDDKPEGSVKADSYFEEE